MRSERGSVLMLVIIFSFIMALTGVVAIYMSAQEEVAAYNYYISAKASAQAKAGFEKAISFIQECREDEQFPEEVISSTTGYTGMLGPNELYFNIKGNFTHECQWEYPTASPVEKCLPHVRQLKFNHIVEMVDHPDPARQWPDGNFYADTRIMTRRYHIVGFGCWGDDDTTESGEKREVQGVVLMTKFSRVDPSPPNHPIVAMEAKFEANTIFELQRNLRRSGSGTWKYYGE